MQKLRSFIVFKFQFSPTNFLIDIALQHITCFYKFCLPCLVLKWLSWTILIVVDTLKSSLIKFNAKGTCETTCYNWFHCTLHISSATLCVSQWASVVLDCQLYDAVLSFLSLSFILSVQNNHHWLKYFASVKMQ